MNLNPKRLLRRAQPMTEDERKEVVRIFEETLCQFSDDLSSMLAGFTPPRDPTLLERESILDFRNQLKLIGEERT